MTIAEVAKLAGVGLYAVSRYFNSPHLVSEEVKAKISKVVEEHHFELNPNRCGPKSGSRAGLKNWRVAFLVLSGMDIPLLQQLQVSNTLICAIQANLQQHGLTLEYHVVNPNGTFPVNFDPQRYDGAILYGMIPELDWAKLKAPLAGLGVVHCFGGNMECSPFGLDYAGYDNRNIGVEAANYLFCRGHRKAVVFNPMFQHHAVYRLRCDTFQQRAEELGMETAVLNAFSEGASIPGGGLNYDATSSLATQYMDAKFQYWTGCFFCSDRFMLGTCFELARRGMDISRLDLIGCDNTDDFLGFFPARPATIDIRLEEIAEQTVNLLMERIHHRNRKVKPAPPQSIIFQPLLIPQQRER